MCGIVGSKDALCAKQALARLRHRGRDGSGLVKTGWGNIGHVLHAVNSHVRQPIRRKGVLAANCEIYNWRELSERYGLPARNDAELVISLIEEIGFREALNRLDGPYAIAYDDGSRLYLARDILGVKPLWYSRKGFASEGKAMPGLKELNPRAVIVQDYKGNTATIRRPFFRGTENSSPDTMNRLAGLLSSAVAKRVPDNRFGILFSGGVDSVVIALIAKQLGLRPTLYTSAMVQQGLREPEDLRWARDSAAYLGLALRERTISIDKVPGIIREVIPIIESDNVVKVGVALPFYLACREAKKDGIKVMFSGLGSEEIFAGYQRHRDSDDINRECRKGLLQMHSRDNYRDDLVSMANTIELRHPFLDHALIRFALSIPGKHKIRDGHVKLILREAAEHLGLSRKFAMRKKRAAQYGSNFDKAIEKLARRDRLSKKAYLESIT